MRPFKYDEPLTLKLLIFKVVKYELPDILNELAIFIFDTSNLLTLNKLDTFKP